MTLSYYICLLTTTYTDIVYCITFVTPLISNFVYLCRFFNLDYIIFAFTYWNCFEFKNVNCQWLKIVGTWTAWTHRHTHIHVHDNKGTQKQIRKLPHDYKIYEKKSSSFPCCVSSVSGIKTSEQLHNQIERGDIDNTNTISCPECIWSKQLKHTNTWPLTFMAWYRHFIKKWRNQTSCMCPNLPS